jgi:hypothetical protein
MIIESIIGALVPVGVEGIKQVITRFFGGVKATTVEDQLKLDSSEIEKIKALAELDKPIGQPSQWVVDLRASARYVGALVVIMVGISTLYVPVQDEIKIIALEAANIAFGFLFGSRIVSNFSRR